MNAHDHIDDYMAGLLSNKALREFEAAMANDDKLRRLVENYDEIKSVSDGVLEMQLLNEVTAVGERKNEVRSTRGRINKHLLLAAAFFVLTAVAYYFYFEKRPLAKEPLLFADVYREPIWPVTRSITNNGSDKYYQSKAASKFLQGDLSMAKLILLDSMDDKTLGRYWLAEMFMAKQEFDSVAVYLPDGSKLARKASRITLVNQWVSLFEGSE